MQLGISPFPFLSASVSPLQPYAEKYRFWSPFLEKQGEKDVERAKWKENTETERYKHLDEHNPAHLILDGLPAETHMYSFKNISSTILCIPC